MRIPRRALSLLLCVALKQLIQDTALGSCSPEALDIPSATGGGEPQGPQEGLAPEAAAEAARGRATHTVEQFCGGPEDLSGCDLVRDGVCILSASPLRLWRRRRWREARRGPQREQQRWVEGLKIRASGDIECTQSAPTGRRVAARRHRLRAQGLEAESRGLTRHLRMSSPGSRGDAALPQRIELCAVGSIRLGRGAKLHCMETILFARHAVSVAERAEVTATGTVLLRGPQLLSPKNAMPTAGSAHSFHEELMASAPERVAGRLRDLLGMKPDADLPRPPQTAEKGAPVVAHAGVTHDVSHSPVKAAASGDAVRSEEPTDSGPFGATQQESELRGGSHGGLGGVACDRCEATVFGHPLSVSVTARGNLFLPLAKGEAGLLYSSNVGFTAKKASNTFFNALVRPAASIQPPRGGGLVVIVGLRRLVVDGQVTSSGEPGWGCETHRNRCEAKGSVRPVNGEVITQKKRYLGSGSLRGLLRRLLTKLLRGSDPSSTCTQLPPAATCAAAGSGGSIVLVSEVLTFASPIQTGRVAAAGGGCLPAPPSVRRSAKTTVGRAFEVSSGECAAGGGGRIAIYAEQPHPLDPVVLAPGGCALRSSRLNLLPCLCGGGGTVFSRAHRRLVVANKLNAAAAASVADSPSDLSLRSRSQQSVAAPHTFRFQQQGCYEGSARQAETLGLNKGEAAATLQSNGCSEGSVASSAPSSGTDALAVLSVQPTPLPVPLHAPSIAVAVEAAVVSIGGGPERSSSAQDFADTFSEREPKVVVGSLLLHGGTRGSALHVLTPLHLHAAEGSIRLRQRSALVLAPCGGSGGEKAAQSEASCSPERLPQAGLHLGVSVVVSSAVSLSVGEEATVRFTTKLRSFSCVDPADPSAASAQQSSSEDSLLGVALLAGERLLLHGVLGLVNAPSDCLPAPLRKTPLLLYGGNEVSVRGEQQLDRLVILSRGTVTLAGRSTVGAPHSCTATRTPLSQATRGGVEDPMKHSAICKALEEYGNTRIAQHLQAAAEAEEQFLDVSLKSRSFGKGGNPVARDDQFEKLAAELQIKGAGKNHAFSAGRWADEVNGEKGAKEEGWLKWLLARFQHLVQKSSLNAHPTAPYISALDGLLQVRYPFSLKALQLKEEPSDLTISAGHEERQAKKIEDGVSVTPPYRPDAADTLKAAHLVTGDLLRKKWKTRDKSLPLVEPVLLRAAPTHRGPLFAELLQKHQLRASPSSKTETRKMTSSMHRGILAKGDDPHNRSGTTSNVAPLSLDEPAAVSLRSGAAEAATHLSLGEKDGVESFPIPGEGFVSAERLTEAGDNHRGAQNETARGAAVPQGATSPWASLDAAVFANNGLILEPGASLKGGALLLCGGRGTALLQGTVDASGRGCQPTQGRGAGSRGRAVGASIINPVAVSSPAEDAHFALCGAGGGGHAGSGGDGVHALTRQLCSGTGGAAYDRGPPEGLDPRKLEPLALNAAWEAGKDTGSFASTASASGGGGDVARAGSGGGVVWVQGQSVVVDGVILADGGGGELMQDAVIDLEVDPQNCPLLGASATTTFKGEARKPCGEEVSVPASCSSHKGVESTTYVAHEWSAPPAVHAADVVLVKDMAGRSWKVEDVEGSAEEGPIRNTISCQLSGILADPAQLGQGGGGGGSIVIETRALLGTGLISAQGGHGGRCTGGGGGGGAVNFLWNASFSEINRPVSRQQYASSSSTKSNMMGVRIRQSSGASVPCGGSTEFSTEHSAGKGFEERSTNVFIPWIRPLEFAAGFSGSVRVTGGSSDPSTVCDPLNLPLGAQGTPGEVRNPLGCPPGYSGWRCTPCPVGFYSLGGSSACLSCSNKPSNEAFYTREGVGDPRCPYACTAGLPDAFANPRCLPPFLFILGQLLCCSALISLGLLCFIVLGVAALLRKLAGRRAQQAWGSGGLIGSGGSFVPATVNTLEGTGSSCGFGPSPSSSLGFLGGSNERRRMHLVVPHLTLEDLPFHVFRIYLHGRNSPHSPWGLDGQPPPFLGPLINSHRFAAFASTANALCGFSSCFVQLYNALSFLYPPLAALFLRAARARRADKMVALCSALAGRPSREGDTHDGKQRGRLDGFLATRLGWRSGRALRNFGGFAAASFWRSIRAREISFALKFGCDPDCTLGFIDVLDLDRNILDYRCSPQLPLVLLAHGDGRIVPFSLSRSLRTPDGSRAGWRSFQADGTSSPADPLQAALEELASPSVWRCIAEVFNNKVKEVAAEELAAMRSLLIAAHTSVDAGVAQGPPLMAKEHDEARRREGSLGPSNPSEFCFGKHEAANAFPRCGRCGRVQLPSLGFGRFSGGPLNLLLGDPLYALRAVGRLCESIRLISDRLLKPHGIAATVCLFANSGLVARANGVQRVTGNLEGASASLRSRKTSHLPTFSSSPLRKRAANTGAPASQGPLDAGRLLLRAASSPSALLDSLRRSSEESSRPNSQDTHGASEEVNGGQAVPASSASSRHHDGRLHAEQGAFTSSLEASGLRSKRGSAYLRQETCKKGAATFDSEAVLALVITEIAAGCDGNEPSVASGQMDVGPKGDCTSAAMAVQSLPPASSLNITSPLDPRRLSPFNKPLAPYIPAAATALSKSVPVWGPVVSSVSPYAHVLRGPSSSRISQDRQVSGYSLVQQMPGNFRGVRRIFSPFNDSFVESQGTSVLSPQGSASWGLTEATEAMDAAVGSDGGPVMCLADAAKRSAGADAQHLRNAVEALQKSALAKLGTEQEAEATASTPEESAGISPVTTTGAAEPETIVETLPLHPSGDVQAGPQRSLHPLALLQRGWRRLRLRNPPTDLARQAP
ncbi:hypothetical protein ACSSS7_005487 [Eimeria intestinalis]